MDERAQSALLNAGSDPSDADLLFDMANLSPRRTGLPFVVWISPRGSAQHDVRVKISRGPKALHAEMLSVAVRPDVRVVDGVLPSHELALLGRWVELNRDVLVRFWEGEIEYTEDALNQLRSI